MTNSHHDISAFLTDYAKRLPLLDAEALGVQLYGAPRLNAFAMFGPDERRVTNILADLLDPKGRHGQGTLFLNAFLSQASLEKVRRDDAVTVTVDEVTAAGRLVDLVISTPASLLGIEVKLWAVQQDNQLADYLKHLKRNAGVRACKLVFLAEQEPLTAKDEVVRMPWASQGVGQGQWVSPVRSILSSVLPEVRAARTRAFLEDFLVWIDESFGGVSVNHDDLDAHLDAVEESFRQGGNRRAIGAVLMMQAELHKRVINAIGEAIQARCPDGFEFAGKDDLYTCLRKRDMPWEGRCPDWPDNLSVAVQAGTGNFGGIFFGVKAPSASHPNIESHEICAAREEIDRAFGDVRSYSYWAYFEDMPAEYRHWTVELAGRLLLESEDGDVANHPKIAAFAEAFANRVALLNEVLSAKQVVAA